MSSKYITIETTGPSKSGKTQIWHVCNKRSNEIVGTIGWWGGFRKYVFFPEEGYHFDEECLAQIAEHLAAERIAQKRLRAVLCKPELCLCACRRCLEQHHHSGKSLAKLKV